MMIYNGIEVPSYVISYKTEEEYTLMKQFLIDNINRIDRNKKSILFSTPAHTGTSHFRLVEPMRAMMLKRPDKYNYVYTENFDMQFLNQFDFIIQHRAGDKHKRMLEVILQTRHRKHVPIIHDVDDIEYDVPKSNPLYHMWMEAGKDKMSIYQLQNSDAVTTTTNFICSEFKKLNKRTSVLRNNFDWTLPQWSLKQDWLEKKNKEGKIVIGWAGLTSHMQDIKMMHDFLKPIHDKYENIYFVLAGMPFKNTNTEIIIDPNTGKKVFKESEVTDEKQTYKWKVKDLYKDLDSNRIEFLDVKSLAEYGEFYSMFNINLSYVESHKFCQMKSEIKMIEGIYYKCIPLSSYVGGYRDFYDKLPMNLKNSNIMCMINGQSEWIRKLSYIIENYESFKPYINELQLYVKDKYNIYNQVDERIELYEKLMREHNT